MLLVLAEAESTSIFVDEKYETIVDETITEVNTLSNRNRSEKWEIFLLTMKTKSIDYSTIRNRAKRKIKYELIRKITRIEENQETEQISRALRIPKRKIKRNRGQRN